MIGFRLMKYLLEHGKRTDKGCLEWPRGKISGGYGEVVYQGKVRLVSRVVCHLYHGLDLDNTKILAMHICDNPPCFEPSHLKLGTHGQNTRDASKKDRLGKTHCKRGHELVEGNLYHSSNGQRQCKKCSDTRMKQRRARLLKRLERRANLAPQANELAN